ncbi:potassium channel subfamily K member 17-like [Amphiura filiformis]|uniref:potassium channel subfamily K member 17-like n=1 Tax=Amphiura filiformis TaxID=82378 RepID=UPI003B213DDB
MTPRTIEGQVFCVIYAIFGIPLMGFVLSTVYKGVLNFFKYAIRNFAFCRRSHKETTSVKHRLIILFVLLLAAFTVLVLVPAVLFKFFEGWNFWEATYYCFITISTIGFGDYVVGNYPDHSEHTRWILKIGAVIYITMGLSFMMALGKIAENEFRRTGNRRKAYRIKMRNSSNRPNSNSSTKKICADGSVWTVKDTRSSAPLCTITETDRISNGGDIIKSTDLAKQTLVAETAFSKNCNENDRTSSSKKHRTRRGKGSHKNYEGDVYDESKQEDHMAFSVSSLMLAANAFDDS